MSYAVDATHIGDVRELLPAFVAAGIRAQCVVTSPPYWALRDYGVAGQIGLEPRFDDYLETLVTVFRHVRELLLDDGVLWLNMGDGYASSGGSGWQGKNGNRADRRFTAVRNTTGMRAATRRPPDGFKPKDLIGQPWRLAFALQADGWYLRSDVIWHKPNPLPESVNDRPTKSHEYLFLLAKSETYYYNAEAIKEPVSADTHARYARGDTRPIHGWATGEGDHSSIAHTRKGRKARKLAARSANTKSNASFDAAMRDMPLSRNKRTVWTISTEAFGGEHFATFPRALVEPCVLAGSRPGDVVFDPFMGSGTVGQVALALGRRYLGIELNPEYVAMGKEHRPPALGLALE